MKKANQSVACMSRPCRWFKGLCQSYFPRILSFNSRSRIEDEALATGWTRDCHIQNHIWSFKCLLISEKTSTLMRKSLCLGVDRVGMKSPAWCHSRPNGSPRFRHWTCPVQELQSCMEIFLSAWQKQTQNLSRGFECFKPRFHRSPQRRWVLRSELQSPQNKSNMVRHQ